MRPSMKTCLSWALLCAGLAASAAEPWTIRDGVPNAEYFLQKNQVGNQYIFFIGGDTLAGKGLRDANLRYSRTMIEAMKRHFGGNPIEIRQSNDGGTWYAQYRCAWGQAVYGEMICSGHLAVIDLLEQEHDVDPHQSEIHLEGLLRQIVRYRATHSRIMVYSPAAWLVKDYLAGKTPDAIARAERLAAHYGVATLDLARAVAEGVKAGRLTLADFPETGGMSDQAGTYCNSSVNAFMDKLLTAHPVPKAPARFNLPAPLFPDMNDNGRIVAYEHPDVKKEGTWKAGQASPIRPFRHVLVSEGAGNAISFTSADCTELGIIDVVGADSAACEYSIDGGAFRRLDPPKNLKGYQVRHVALGANLPKGRHTLVLRTLGSGDDTSGVVRARHVFRLGGILLNGTVAREWEGLSPLARIDAIYSQMDEIRYVPPADRFKYIPKTMKTLREGGTLRMVLLGDSIIGNTSGSQFDLLLKRDFPKAEIKKITSIRSSTGCNWYCQENRVQEWVLRHEPDLLVIGGISNGSDAEVVRSVVKQVRAARPGQEVLLLTPVFGALRDDHIRTWTYEVDETKPNFRGGMKRVAREEGCAFFDMTGPWWRYIQETGKTPGWFMGDAVHANARGCQIIARLLELWFALPERTQPPRVPYGKTVGDRFWMWGHHPDSFDTAQRKSEIYNLPHGRRIDMAAACRDMGIPGCCVVRWCNLPRAVDLPQYMTQFGDTKRIAFSVTDGAAEPFDEKVRIGFEHADRMPNLTTFFMDDFWCTGMERPPLARLREVKAQLAARGMKLAVVLYADSNGLKPEFRDVLALCDEVSYWFWCGKNTGGIEESVERLRAFVGPEKPILLGQYMWDFGGKREMPRDMMEAQLAASGRLLAAGKITGLIFHCTPLVDLNLGAVNASREWIRIHAKDRAVK